MAGQTDPVKTDGSTDWSQGVNSVACPTVQSESNPNGLPRQALSWLVNATVRDGGITQRAGWKKKSSPGGMFLNLVASGLGLYQGSVFYEPEDEDNPYIIAAIGGHILKIDADFASQPVDLTQQFDLVGARGLSATEPEYFFTQAENYLIIQDGTEANLPLFWDGTNLRQSNGITGTLTRGSPQPATFQIATTQSWVIPAQGATSLVIPLAGPYSPPNGGNLGDNIAISGTVAGTNHGVFRVVTVAAAGITLYGVAPIGVGATVAPGVLVCEYTTPGLNSGGTEDVGATPQPVILSNGFWNVPAVGKTGTVLLTAVYKGSVGDVVEVYSTNWPTPGFVDYGNFTVVSFNATNQIVLRCNSSTFAGTQVNQGDFLFSVQSVRSFTQAITPNGANGHAPQFTIPDPTYTIDVYWPTLDGTYAGRLYDIVSLTVQGNVNIGTFRVIALGSFFDGDHNYPRITLQTISLKGSYSGNHYASFTLKVIVSPDSPFYIVFDAGQWKIPDSTETPVTIEIIYEGQGLLPFPLGPAYPGNIGDIITLYNATGTVDFGTFKVTGFDSAGGITLQTVASNYVHTTFTGANSFSLAITTLPSTIGLYINELPAARQMIYYMGRIFYNVKNVISGGDIVKGPSGTAANGYVDSVLCVTENPLCFGGDGFTLPTQSGDITGFSEPNTIDASLGQGLLLISTRKTIYAMQVPISRNDWISADSNNQPKIVEVQFDAGFVSDNANVLVNGDVYYMTWKKDLRSLVQATRLFGQPGNVPCSAEERRLLKFTDARLLSFASGIEFDNRLLMTALPMQTPFGVVHQAILPLDFTPISTNRDRQQPCWEGHLQGLQVLKLLEQDFDGVDRAFALTLSQDSNYPGAVELWELTADNRFENEGQTNEARVTWQAEFPALEWGDITRLKKLVSAELWLDRIFGQVELFAEWRPDSESCWRPWMQWQVCSPRNATEAETPGAPAAYPTVCGEGFKSTMTLPKPPEYCESATGRPAHIGYQFQTRLTITGFCRVRGFWLMAEFCDRKLYANMVCAIKDFVCNLWKFLT